jgi:hypothetical protein
VSEPQATTEPTPERRSAFVKILLGELGLPMTYWGLGVGGSILLVLILGGLSLTVTSPWFLRSVPIVSLAWGALMAVAIWNAATKYQGAKVWAILAKVAVVLGALRILSSLATLPVELVDPVQHQLNQAAESQNRNVPRMIDKTTRLTKVSAEKSQLTYHYVLIDRKASEMNPALFERLQREQLVKATCEHADVKSLFERDVTLVFSYSGNDQEPIASIVVTPKDCAGRKP